MPTATEQAEIDAYLGNYFAKGFNPGDIKPEEATIDGIVAAVTSMFGKKKYPLGLAFNFAVLAQWLSAKDNAAKAARAGWTEANLFAHYPRVTSKNGVTQNSLTVTFKNDEYGIRKIEEEFVDLLLRLSRPGYPSAYVYNTGQWHKYVNDLLVPCFQLSESGRYELLKRLLDFALKSFSVGTSLGRTTARIRLFEEVLDSYERSAKGEKAGSVFQGVACGFIMADRPHLSIIVDKTRTGSARQARIGDIDGYCGLDLEVSVEVKDEDIAEDRIERELGEFLQKVQANHVMGIAFVRSADEATIAKLAEAGVACLTQETVRAIVTTWDWQKQNDAVNGMLHYLAHVEQHPDAVQRLLEFIQSRDEEHESLVFLKSAAGRPN